MLKSCDVDYSGGTDSPKFFKNDYPAKITMSLEFQEVILLNRDRMEQDNLIKDEGAPTGDSVMRFRF